MRKCLLAAAFVMASTGAGFAQDVEAGQGVFKRMCFPCHDAGPGAKVKLGPPLNGLDGRAAGTMPGFNYSEANKNSGITWGDAIVRGIHQEPDAADAGHAHGLRRRPRREGHRQPVGLPQAVRRERRQEVSRSTALLNCA